MALFQNLRWIHDVRQVGTGPLWGETRDRRLVGSRLLLSLRSPAQHSLVELSPAGSRLPLGLSGPDWSSPAVEGSSAHSSLDGGFSGLLSKDSRFSAEIPGTWPAQTCSTRTRRCAMAARKLSTYREEQRTAVRGWLALALLREGSQVELEDELRGTL